MVHPGDGVQDEGALELVGVVVGLGEVGQDVAEFVGFVQQLVEHADAL